MSTPFGDEYVIEEVPDFNDRVMKILPLREWDSASYSFIWKLQHDPTLDAHNSHSNHWVANLDSFPPLTVFYTVDADARVVWLLDVRRTRDVVEHPQEEP